MKIFTLTLLCGAVMMQSTTLFAAEIETSHIEKKEEKRLEHYIHEKILSNKKALMMLDVKISYIAKILQNKTISDSNLEEIHEISYSLEAAVDKLRKSQNTKQEVLLDILDESVQALHFASENHEEDKTRKWFLVMQPAALKVSKLF